MTRKEQAALTREKLLTATQKLISEKGYDKTSIVDITKECGMSVGNFYHYFKSKEEVITSLEREIYENSMETLKDMSQKPILEQLTYYFHNMASFAVQSFGINFDQQWAIYHLSNPTSLDDPSNKVNISLAEITTCLESAIENKELREDTPLRSLAETILFPYQGAQFYYISTHGEFDLISWSDTFCQTQLLQLLKPYYL